MATTSKEGSRHANCPMLRHSLVRQRRTAAIPLVLVTSGTWNGCNPNTVMSINWRASLVPAAAVIPAPRAYTDIAAVKTLVVRCWVAGLLGGGGGLSASSFPSGLGGVGGSLPIQPPAVCSCTQTDDGTNCSCSKSPSVGADAVAYPTPVILTAQGQGPVSCILPSSTTGVYHR